MNADEWRSQAACADFGSLFLGGHVCGPECPRSPRSRCPDMDNRSQANRERAEACKEICRRCPVMFQCRQWVLSEELPVYGVVGGLSEDERRRWTWRDRDNPSSVKTRDAIYG